MSIRDWLKWTFEMIASIWSAIVGSIAERSDAIRANCKSSRESSKRVFMRFSARMKLISAMNRPISAASDLSHAARTFSRAVYTVKFIAEVVSRVWGFLLRVVEISVFVPTGLWFRLDVESEITGVEGVEVVARKVLGTGSN